MMRSLATGIALSSLSALMPTPKALAAATPVGPSSLATRAELTNGSDLEYYADWSWWSSYYNYYYFDFLGWIGNYRVNTYRSAYDSALMRNALAEARYYYYQIGQANGDLLRLQRRSRELESLVRRVESYGRNIDRIVGGAVPSETHVAIRYFMRVLGDDIIPFGSELVPPIDAFSFVLRSPYSTRYDPTTGQTVRIPNELEAFPGGNLLQFLEWLRLRPFNVSPGSDAHFTLLRVRSRLAGAAQDWLAVLVQNREAIENGAMSPWGAMQGPVGELPAREPPPDA